MGFRMGKFSYFLSINQFSDKTPQEIKKIYSGMKLGKEFELMGKRAKKDSQNREREVKQQQQEGAVDFDFDQLQQELERIVVEKEPGFEILAKELGLRIDSEKNRLNSLRRMRTSAHKINWQEKSVRGSRRGRSKLAINEFRSMVDEIAPKESSKFVKRVPSTNDQYQPIELVSQASSGLEEEKSLTEEQIIASKWKIPGVQFIREQLSKLSSYFKEQDTFEDALDEDVEELFEDATESEAYLSDWYVSDTEMDNMGIWADNKGQVMNIGKIKNARYGVQTIEEDDGDQPGLEQKLFVDWQESGCLTVVRDQRDCGSCYAFTTIALMEFLHCQQTGKLVPFSEQYMVDCGKSHVNNIEGCDGSDLPSMANFVEDWGVELRSNYPYLAKETSCPYDRADVRRAGYKKPKFQKFKYIFGRNYWPGVLKYGGPMIAVIRVPTDFSYYGGMIHDGKNCVTEDGLHAMLLVGHGIEDGQEYWLYRNSHGYYWGEQGYFKLSKKAQENCFGPHTNTNFKF